MSYITDSSCTNSTDTLFTDLSDDLDILYLKRLRSILIALFFSCHCCLCWGCQQDVSYTQVLEDCSCSVREQCKENQHWQELDAANCALQTSRKKLCNDLYYRNYLCRPKTGKQLMYFFITPAKNLLEWKSVPAQYCSGVTAGSQIHFIHPGMQERLAMEIPGLTRWLFMFS